MPSLNQIPLFLIGNDMELDPNVSCLPSETPTYQVCIVFMVKAGIDMKYRLTENRLRGMIRKAVKSVLREENEDFWSTGDINPKAIEGFRKDCIARDMEKYKQEIEEYGEIIKNAARSGDSYKVKQYSKYLTTIANLINNYKLEDLRKVWREQDNA